MNEHDYFIPVNPHGKQGYIKIPHGYHILVEPNDNHKDVCKDQMFLYSCRLKSHESICCFAEYYIIAENASAALVKLLSKISLCNDTDSVNIEKISPASNVIL